MTTAADDGLRLVTLMNDVTCYVRANYAELAPAAMKVAEPWTVPRMRQRLEAERRDGYFDGEEPAPGWEAEWAGRNGPPPLTDLEIRRFCGPLKCAVEMIAHHENTFGGAYHYSGGDRSLASMSTDEAALILVLTWCFHDEAANELVPVALAVQGLPWDDSDLESYFERTGSFVADFECREWGADRIYKYQWPRVVQAALDRSMAKLQPRVRAALREGSAIADGRERALLILRYTLSTSPSRVLRGQAIADAYGYEYSGIRSWLNRCGSAEEIGATRGAGSGRYLTPKGVAAADRLLSQHGLALDGELLDRLCVRDADELMALREERLRDRENCTD